MKTKLFALPANAAYRDFQNTPLTTTPTPTHLQYTFPVLFFEGQEN